MTACLLPSSEVTVLSRYKWPKNVLHLGGKFIFENLLRCIMTLERVNSFYLRASVFLLSTTNAVGSVSSLVTTLRCNNVSLASLTIWAWEVLGQEEILLVVVILPSKGLTLLMLYLLDSWLTKAWWSAVEMVSSVQSKILGEGYLDNKLNEYVFRTLLGRYFFSDDKIVIDI